MLLAKPGPWLKCLSDILLYNTKSCRIPATEFMAFFRNQWPLLGVPPGAGIYQIGLLSTNFPALGSGPLVQVLSPSYLRPSGLFPSVPHAKLFLLALFQVQPTLKGQFAIKAAEWYFLPEKNRYL
jgi:hypothetical protein